MHAIVHTADIQDRDGGAFVMATMFGMYPFLIKLYADGGYQGPLFRRAVAKIMARLNVEIVKRSDHAKGFVVLPEALGGRTNVRMARPVQASRQRLGESQPKGARISAPRFNRPHAQKTMQSRMIFPDELSVSSECLKGAINNRSSTLHSSILLSVVGNAECELTAEWHKKTVREAGRFCYLRIGVARLVELLFRISIVLARSLALLARFRAAALLTGLLTRRLIPAGRVGFGSSCCFLSWEHRNNGSLIPRRSDKRKWQFALLARCRPECGWNSVWRVLR